MAKLTLPEPTAIERFTKAAKSAHVMFIVFSFFGVVLMLAQAITPGSGCILIALGLMLYLIGDVLHAVAQMLKEKSKTE